MIFKQAELEKALTRLKVEKAELSSELREETAKGQMILDDLRRSNDVSTVYFCVSKEKKPPCKKPSRVQRIPLYSNVFISYKKFGRVMKVNENLEVLR